MPVKHLSAPTHPAAHDRWRKAACGHVVPVSDTTADIAGVTCRRCRAAERVWETSGLPRLVKTGRSETGRYGLREYQTADGRWRIVRRAAGRFAPADWRLYRRGDSRCVAAASTRRALQREIARLEA